MKVLGLISGGKDSCFSLLECVRNGHEVIALGNLHPPAQVEELDSFMFQTVGSTLVEAIAECMQLPLIRREIRGRAVNQGLEYSVCDGDEVEDLHDLLAEAKESFPQLEAVSSGAVLSTYQRNRVEAVCSRLGLISLAYMWQRDQTEVFDEMLKSGVEAVLVKIASMGLKANMLGKPLIGLRDQFVRMNEDFGFHVCGEGGEYETICLDCPLFEKRIVLDKTERVVVEDDSLAPVAYLRVIQFHLEPKREAISGENGIHSRPIVAPDVSRLSKIRLTNSGWEDLGELFFSHVSSSRIRMDENEDHDWFAVGPCTALAEYRDLDEEVHSVMSNLSTELEGSGLSLADLFFVRLIVSDMDDFTRVNDVYCRYFGSCPPPSRVCV